MKKRVCERPGCLADHHAKGLCKRHYSREYNGKEEKQRERGQGTLLNVTPAEPEPKKPRTNTDNFAFFLNQKFIERIYSELIKVYEKPLYKSTNGKHVDSYVILAANLAGCNFDDYKENDGFFNSYLDELIEWAQSRDKARFMECLANWEQRAAVFKSKGKVTQLSLFKHTR